LKFLLNDNMTLLTKKLKEYAFSMQFINLLNILYFLTIDLFTNKSLMNAGLLALTVKHDFVE